jgi:type IV pilus assembly protein PilN
MRVSINLASRPFADLAPALKSLRIAIGALAAAALVLAIGLHAVHHKAEEARAREHALDGKIAQIRQERQGYENLMRQPDNARTLAQAESLNQLFDEKSFSWTMAMEDLETVLPAGVQVTTIEPTRAKDGHITLRLRVIGPRDRAVDLEKNLEHSKRFLMPRIVGENSESSGRPGETPEPVSASSRVDFDLLADYNPATLEERRQAKEKAAAQHAGKAGDPPGVSEQRGSTTHGRAPYTGMARPHAPLPPRAGGPQ